MKDTARLSRERFPFAERPIPSGGRSVRVLTTALLLAVPSWSAAQTWTKTSEAVPPLHQAGHTAVWTGSRMIVWGGSSSGTALDTGLVYDPATDTWTAMSTTGAPSARSGHTAVWTGSKMIVWGGDSGSWVNTGGIYDLATDTWTPTSTSGAPSARMGHTAVWTGSKMIIWGNRPTGDGGIYDPETDTWTPTSLVGAPLLFVGHAAVWTGSKMIVWGGTTSGSLRTDTGGQYDPATDTWTPTSTSGAPSARSGHTAVWTGSKMIIWGGNLPSDNTGGIYDPVTDTWMATFPTSLTPRMSHSAVWTGSKMIIWGGRDWTGPVNTGGSYDPVANSWSATPTPADLKKRHAHTTVWTGSRMIAPGGLTFLITGYLPHGAIYDPGLATFSLSLDIQGTGMGTVFSVPRGIGCDQVCATSSVDFPSGTAVTLWAAPGDNSIFSGWGGGVCSGSEPTCTVTMDAAHSVTATFDLTLADLSILKTDGQATAVPGSPLVYTIMASNAGPHPATGATVADIVPATVTGVTWTCVAAGGGSCTASGSGSINDLVSLPVGGTVTYTLGGTISASATGSLSNTATIAAPSGVIDPNLTNNSATDTGTLTPEADLSITKTDGQGEAVTGEPITYTIVVSNAGPSMVTGATITDTVPVEIIGATWTCAGASGGSCTASGSGDINDTVNLPVGGSVTYTLDGTTSASVTGLLSNTATVTAPGDVADVDLTNNSATDTDTVVGLDYFTLAPCRVVDTRELGAPIGGPVLQGQETRIFAVAGYCDISATAKALSINVTVTQPSSQGHVRLFPAGLPVPTVSTINYTAGQTRANNAVVVLDSNVEMAAFVGQPPGTTVHLIIDVNGYFE